MGILGTSVGKSETDMGIKETSVGVTGDICGNY